MYRKLGIQISDIKKLLENEEKDILLGILADKEKELKEKTIEFEELKAFAMTGKTEHLSEAISYESIGQAIMEQKSGGNTIEYFVNTTFNYPTMAEAYRVAALNGLNRLF